MNEKKKNILKWFLVVIGIAVVTHWVVIFCIPRGIMGIAIAILSSQMNPNVLHHAPPPNYENQRIVRSSPDLIYSAATFDVSEAPIRVTSPLTGDYMSLSMYATDTACFYVKNDKQVDGGFDVVVYSADRDKPKVEEGVETIAAPTDKGFLLFRNFTGNGKQIPIIEKKRVQAKIEVLE